MSSPFIKNFIQNFLDKSEVFHHFKVSFSLWTSLLMTAQFYPTLCSPLDCSFPGSYVHAILQARILEWVAIPFSRDLPNPGIKPRSPILQADSLPAETPGKPKNTGVGSLSLFWGIFLTQGLNRGLLHCRPILYQLSYQRS